MSNVKIQMPIQAQNPNDKNKFIFKKDAIILTFNIWILFDI
jgi:hypothetical protein